MKYSERFEKLETGKGKLSVKFILSRCLWQAYCGGAYLPLACGMVPSDAVDELLKFYVVPVGTTITIFGGGKTGKSHVITEEQL